MDFPKIVSRIFVSWSAYQYALKSRLGGHQTTEKSEWLESELVNFYLQNKNLEPEEVYDWISEVLFNEFDLILEDGGLEDISDCLCRAFQLISSKNEQKLEEFLAKLPKEETVKESVNLSKISEENNESGSDSEVEMNGQTSGEPMEIDSQPIEENVSKNSSQQEDSWTVVSRKKKR